MQWASSGISSALYSTGKVLAASSRSRSAAFKGECWNPEYRAWKLAILDDLYSSYTFDGLLWGVERWGPLHQVLAGETPCCFCEHCGKLAREAGLNWRRVKAGYAAFGDTVRRNRACQGR